MLFGLGTAIRPPHTSVLAVALGMLCVLLKRGEPLASTSNHAACAML